MFATSTFQLCNFLLFIVQSDSGGASKPGIAEFIKYSDNTLTIKLKDFFKTNNIQYTKLKVKFE